MSKKLKQRKKVVNVKSHYNDTNKEYPVFCFKYFQNHSIKKCKNVNLFLSFCERLEKLANLGWEEIGKSLCHTYGFEPIPLTELKCYDSVKKLEIVTKDVKKLLVFRYTGNNLPFLGLRGRGGSNIFHIILIETEFGDIYDHE